MVLIGVTWGHSADGLTEKSRRDSFASAETAGKLGSTVFSLSTQSQDFSTFPPGEFLTWRLKTPKMST